VVPDEHSCRTEAQPDELGDHRHSVVTPGNGVTVHHRVAGPGEGAILNALWQLQQRQASTEIGHRRDRAVWPGDDIDAARNDGRSVTARGGEPERHAAARAQPSSRVGASRGGPCTKYTGPRAFPRRPADRGASRRGSRQQLLAITYSQSSTYIDTTVCLARLVERSIGDPQDGGTGPRRAQVQLA